VVLTTAIAVTNRIVVAVVRMSSGREVRRMAKTWSADNPKAALMARKRAVIVDAALKAFLEAGYAEASVNRIAAAAGVSIKTVTTPLSTSHSADSLHNPGCWVK